MSRYYKTGQLYPKQKEEVPSPNTNENMNGWAAMPPLPRMSPNIQPEKPKVVSLKVSYKMLESANPGSPEVWGPAFWFSLHNGAARYPSKASPLWKQRMKSFIRGIPVMVPCEKCADHATAYIESRSDLDHVVENKDNLFKFFVDFHNFVNDRLGKARIPMEAAHKMYQGSANVLTVVYGPP
jgi:hypothetical protein